MPTPREEIKESVIEFINRVAKDRNASPSELEAMAAMVAVVWGQSWYSLSASETRP